MSAHSKPAARFDRSIVDGPIRKAVWRIAWPTMLLNVIGGLQGVVDHAMVGHFVGYAGNAAIGVAWQIFLVVIIFITSLYTGMGVLVARFAGAGDPDKVITRHPGPQCVRVERQGYRAGQWQGSRIAHRFGIRRRNGHE